MLSSLLVLACLSVPPSDPVDGCCRGVWAITETYNSQKAKATWTTKTVTTYRNPIGHTHTCVNGHTWDHQVTSGHRCPMCGSTQFIQDRSPRKVTVVQTVRVQVPVQQSTPLPRPGESLTVTVPQQQQPVFFIKSMKTANCPNGNCPYAR